MQKLHNIIHLIGFYPEIGGPVRSTGNLIKALNQKGIKCKIISPLPPNYNEEKLTKLINEFDIEFYELDRFYQYIPSYSSKFARVLHKNLDDIDIIHIHGIFDYYTYYICKNISSKKIVLSLRGSLVEWGLKQNISSYIKKKIYLNTIGKMILDRVDVIHLTGEYEKYQFHKIVGHSFDKKIVVIPNGLDLKIPDVSPKLFKDRFRIDKSEKLILFLGRLHKVKGLDLLVPAFDMLNREFSDTLLVIAGPDENGYKREIEKMIKRYRIEDKVIFTGYIDGELKWSAYKAADVFVLPSYSENFGMVVLEAMAAGTPVVMSKEVGISWDIQDTDTAILVDTNVESLYLGIKKIFSENLSGRLIENAYKFIARYDIESIAEEMIKVYKSLAA